MTHASLFSGIGGFDLAAAWAGWTNAFNCEIDPFCRRVLKYHFPESEQYGDIKTTDFTVWCDRIDVLTGGFPCQPFSVAGKLKGTEDDRYLWPAMLGVIRTIRPRWVVGENVYGLVNWSEGMVFDTVCTDLENEGYEVGAYVLPACAVDAPHRRDRIWIVAHRADARSETMPKRPNGIHADAFASDSSKERRRKRAGKTHKRQEYQKIGRGFQSTIDRLSGCGITSDPDSSGGSADYWKNFPTQSPVCSRNDGLSAGLGSITFPKWRRESIRAYGNAIVPQVALQIFETINEYEKL